MRNYNKDVICQIAKSYMSSKLILTENELGITNRPNKYLEPYRFNVYHIEQVVKSLSEDDRFIISNEVLLGKTGNWYREYMSAPTYYRHRRQAYANFVRRII